MRLLERPRSCHGDLGTKSLPGGDSRMSAGGSIHDAGDAGDRLIVRLDAGGPIELGGLTDSFAALARLYERHYRVEGEPAPKLYVTRLETGSIIAEIVPLALLFRDVIPIIDGSMKIGDFAGRLSKGLRAFSNIAEAPTAAKELPSRDDARDLREFIKPITGRSNGCLSIKHARYIKRDGDAETIVEYAFDERELNRAAVNIEQVLSAPEMLPPPSSETSGFVREAMLFFDQASRAPGKEQGRTSDKAIVPEVSDKPLPVWFRKSVNDLKDKMVRGDENPITNTFVVDVHVQRLNGEPKGYIVTELHKIIQSDE